MKCGTLSEFMHSKFTVIKNEDAKKYLSKGQRILLEDICRTIEMGRKLNSKKSDNEYVVVNLDEKYASEVVNIMKKNGHVG
jgi:hypothetical protein